MILKGTDVEVDSYSAFCEGPKGIELKNKLEEYGVKEVYVCGLAFDFCVGSTALDSKKYGFETFVIREGTKSVGQETEVVMAERLKERNVPVVSFEEVNAK